MKQKQKKYTFGITHRECAVRAIFFPFICSHSSLFSLFAPILYLASNFERPIDLAYTHTQTHTNRKIVLSAVLLSRKQCHVQKNVPENAIEQHNKTFHIIEQIRAKVERGVRKGVVLYGVFYLVCAQNINSNTIAQPKSYIDRRK